MSLYICHICVSVCVNPSLFPGSKCRYKKNNLQERDVEVVAIWLIFHCRYPYKKQSWMCVLFSLVTTVNDLFLFLLYTWIRKYNLLSPLFCFHTIGYVLSPSHHATRFKEPDIWIWTCSHIRLPWNQFTLLKEKEFCTKLQLPSYFDFCKCLLKNYALV